MPFIKTSIVERGDIIRVKRSKGYYHFGIASSNNTVIHFTGDNNDSILDSKGVKVRETSLERFLRKDDLEVMFPYDSDFPRDIVVARARDFVGQEEVLGGKYNLVSNNCEHFARYCYYDEHQSKQVEKITNVAAKAINKVGRIVENFKMDKVSKKKSPEVIGEFDFTENKWN